MHRNQFLMCMMLSAGQRWITQASDEYGWRPDCSGGCQQDLLGKRRRSWARGLLWGGQGAVLGFSGDRLCLPGQPWCRPPSCTTGWRQPIHSSLTLEEVWRNRVMYTSPQAMEKSLEFFSLHEGLKEKMGKGPEYQVFSIEWSLELKW